MYPERRKTRPVATRSRTPALWSGAIVLLAIAVLAIVGSWRLGRGSEPATFPERSTRMPISHPILESDRPDLLAEPGMTIVQPDETHTPDEP